MASTLLPSTLRTSLLEKVGFSVGFGVGFMRTPQTPKENSRTSHRICECRKTTSTSPLTKFTSANSDSADLTLSDVKKLASADLTLSGGVEPRFSPLIKFDLERSSALRPSGGSTAKWRLYGQAPADLNSSGIVLSVSGDFDSVVRRSSRRNWPRPISIRAA